MPAPSSIHPDLKDLFEFTRSGVTEDDIRDNVPNDPGAWNYYMLWNGIRRTGGIPSEISFDLAEVIGLTGWSNPSTRRNPGSFLAFRKFTGSVGMIFLNRGWTDGGSLPAPNYIACNLLLDFKDESEEGRTRLRKVFSVTGAAIKADKGWLDDPEHPFFIFGEMILAQRAGDFQGADEAAERLISEEEEAWTAPENYVPGSKDGAFLFCLTNYLQMYEDWLRLTKELRNPLNAAATARVMDLFAGGSR